MRRILTEQVPPRVRARAILGRAHRKGRRLRGGNRLGAEGAGSFGGVPKTPVVAAGAFSLLLSPSSDAVVLAPLRAEAREALRSAGGGKDTCKAVLVELDSSMPAFFSSPRQSRRKASRSARVIVSALAIIGTRLTWP